MSLPINNVSRISRTIRTGKISGQESNSAIVFSSVFQFLVFDNSKEVENPVLKIREKSGMEKPIKRKQESKSQ